MKKPVTDFTPPEMTTRDSFSVLATPYWGLVFLLVMLPFYVAFFFIGGLFDIQTYTEEQVFAVYALIAGIGSDIFLRRWLHVALVVIRKPRIPFILFWIAAGIFVITFQPMENFPRWLG